MYTLTLAGDSMWSHYIRSSCSVWVCVWLGSSLVEEEDGMGYGWQASLVLNDPGSLGSLSVPDFGFDFLSLETDCDWRDLCFQPGFLSSKLSAPDPGDSDLLFPFPFPPSFEACDLLLILLGLAWLASSRLSAPDSDLLLLFFFLSLEVDRDLELKDLFRDVPWSLFLTISSPGSSWCFLACFFSFLLLCFFDFFLCLGPSGGDSGGGDSGGGDGLGVGVFGAQPFSIISLPSSSLGLRYFSTWSTLIVRPHTWNANTRGGQKPVVGQLLLL